MALNYKDTTKLVTTDDVVMSGNTTELGENLSDVLLKQSKDIAQLKGNVKWIAKYGGVGGGSSSGGGGGEISTSLKYEATIRYTDINGMGAVVKANLKQDSLSPILCKGNTKITVDVTITSMMSTTGSYAAVLNYGSGRVEVLIPSVKGYATLSFMADSSNPSYVCQLTVRGETVHTLGFQVFTQILLNDIHLSSEGRRFINNSSISSSDLADLTLNMDIQNLMESLFRIEVQNVSINDTVLDVGLNSHINVGYLFRVYGLYNLVVNFKAINRSTEEEYEYILNQVFIYKESDKVFVYCFTNSDEFLVYNAPVTEIPIGTNLRNIPLMFRVYGTAQDPVGTSYIVNINGEPYKKPCSIQLDYLYSLANTLTEDSQDYVEVPISFSIGEDISTYYVYIKKAGELAYIFTKENNQKCFGALGDNTDSIVKNGTVNLPNRTPGETYWIFTNNTNNKLSVNASCIPKGYLYNMGDTVTVSNFISSEILNNDQKMYDTIVNIGINYKDTSYENPIFTFGDNIGSPTTIEFYRNKIVYGSSSTDRFGMPDDGKFHLITIYFKLNYRTTGTSTNWGQSFSFAVYIDGVLDVKPTETNYVFGTRSIVTIHPGANLYNFFGIEIFNPVPSVVEGALGYSDVVRKYVLDYDPFIVSNYYMCYATLHYEDLGYSESPFSDTLLNSMSRDIYANLIDNSAYNYVNYYSLPQEQDRIAYNKFIPVNILLFCNLLDRDNSIPMYRIVPDYTDQTSVDQGLHIFVKKTMESFTEETLDSAVTNGYTCRFQRYDFNLNQWVDILKDVVLDEEGHMHTVKFVAKFQGSSTLLYSVKNFSIETQPFEDRDTNIVYLFYFNPDSALFDYPETSFNLKADLVDSSSCTNNVMGNFINEYMDSPFNDVNHTYKSCLSGRPILLFMCNNTSLEGDSTASDLFLGIYNLNLNRSSVNNLGYQRMPELEQQEANFSDTYCVVTNQNTAITVPNGMAVAEMQGNGNLYDFSQFDYGLLHRIFGDFYTVTGGRVVKEYSPAIQLLCRDFAYYVYSKILHNNGDVVFNGNDYTLDRKPNAREDLASRIGLDNIGYYALVGSGSQSTLQFRTLGSLPNPNNIIIVDYNTLANDSSSYRTLDDKGFAIVGNAVYQFHLLYSAGVNPSPLVHQTTNYYYVEQINPIYTDNNEQEFDLITSLKYYMVCMAFAMVDSVQKNMNIKRPNNEKTWYPQFYDMDTALALDNSGNNSNYKAFSDYVDKDGNIISDYAGSDAKAWFDTPSSYLFMFAKYDALLNHQSEEDETGLKFHTPLEYWMSLRGVAQHLNISCAGALRDADTFCNEYLNSYLVEDIPPIIWNLNYMYKYFSETKNQSQTGDTEESRFNGRMIYRRRTWLEQRLHYLDALFGISNARTVGKTQILVSDGPKPTSNEDIEVCGTMFPNFAKGITEVNIDTRVKDLPRTPLILLSAASTFKLYITNDLGYANILGNVTANNEIAFNGTKHLLEVGDCGLFLQHPSDSNYIQGDQIKEIVISSKCESITLNMANLPSVKRIVIGNKGSRTLVSRYIRIIGDELAETELTIIIKNVGCLRLSISNCTLALDSILLNITSSDLSDSDAGAILSITNCTFLGDLNISDSSFQSMELSTNIHYGNFSISSRTNSTLSVSSVYFRDSSKAFTIDAPKLVSLRVYTSEIYKLFHKSSLRLSECSIGLRRTTSGGTALVALNYDYMSSSAIQSPWVINSTNSNSSLLLIEVSLTDFDSVVLSVPLFANLQELRLTGKFKLGKMGLTGVGLPSVQLKDSSALNGIIGFDSNIDSAFAQFNGDILSENDTELTQSQWDALMSNVTSAILCFGKRTNGMEFNTIKRILQAVQLCLSRCDIKGLFASTNILVGGNVNNWTNSYEQIAELTLVYPDSTKAINGGSYVFHNTNLRRLTSLLASKFGNVYRDFMGVSGSDNYIESGALRLFTIVTDGIDTAGWSNTSYDITSFWPRVHFFDILNGDILEHTTIKYSEEFEKAQTLYMQIYTSAQVSFDFENGMGSNIKTYRGLFNRLANDGNILNISNMFNNTTSLIDSKVSADFHNLQVECQLHDTSGLTVQLYPYLVNNGVINEKAYRVLASGTTNSESYTLEGSFAKTITASDFISLIQLLANSSKELICIFHNCAITNIPKGQEQQFFEQAFKNKLYNFSNLCCAFRKSKFFNTAGEQVPMILDKAFVSVLEEDGETFEFESIKASNLRRAFEYCYIEPFTNTLGIASKKVGIGYRAFAECTYNYPRLDLYAIQYTLSRVMSFEMPRLEDFTSENSFAILPLNFLNFCQQTADAVLEMFAYTASNYPYSTEHLTGCIPEQLNWFGENVTVFKDTFKRCNIYYHPYYTNIQKTTIDPNRWIIFPGWYTALTDSFDVYIPLPLLTLNASDSDPIMCSVFGYYSDIQGSLNYGTLPRFADLLSTYRSGYTVTNLLNGAHRLCRVFLSLDITHEIPPRGGSVKNIIPIMLSPLVEVEPTSTIVRLVSRYSGENYYPINATQSGSGLSLSNIYKGALVGLGECPLATVTGV